LESDTTREKEFLIPKKTLNKIKTSDLRYAVIIVLIFLISRIIYWALGIRFNVLPLDRYWHYIDPSLLKNNLLESLWHLHSQPPLFNLYLGAVLKLSGQSLQTIFHISYLLCGLILSLSLFFIMFRLSVSVWISLIFTSLFILSPESILYENFLFYTYPVSMMLCTSGLVLYEFLRSKRLKYGIIFFLLLSAIVLTRGMFHILWFILIAFLIILFKKDCLKKILLSLLIPFLLILGVYVKNYLLFGNFTTSTWLGMHFSRISTFQLSKDERLSFIERMKLSPFAQIEPFGEICVYRDFLDESQDSRFSHIPVLTEEYKSSGDANYNHILYIEISKKYLQDDLYVIRTRPDAYLKGLNASLHIFFSPSHDYKFLEPNRDRISSVEKIYSRFVFGRFFPKIKQGIFLILATMTVLIYGFTIFFKSMKRKIYRNKAKATLVFLWINIIYVTSLSNLLEVGENNRFRMLINPLIIILFAHFIDRFLKKKINVILASIGIGMKKIIHS